ncbi:hypothetical protein IscW_ISCW018593 [Ixodes scapularis]|uniref:Uncharacterized protein n=1 Tax=Ixodes scapularis TaxID=6945 RepID=B7PM83_IXOSC|nr:hypothetical protein IscW_ISCW018593 [Ixodes scapularis]|eukprot:XP_002434881.1 hypothetical protein IscW_ISCW018593 [Ixodes scapularis]
MLSKRLQKSVLRSHFGNTPTSHPANWSQTKARAGPGAKGKPRSTKRQPPPLGPHAARASGCGPDSTEEPSGFQRNPRPVGQSAQSQLASSARVLSE